MVVNDRLDILNWFYVKTKIDAEVPPKDMGLYYGDKPVPSTLKSYGILVVFDEFDQIRKLDAALLLDVPELGNPKAGIGNSFLYRLNLSDRIFRKDTGYDSRVFMTTDDSISEGDLHNHCRGDLTPFEIVRAIRSQNGRQKFFVGDTFPCADAYEEMVLPWVHNLRCRLVDRFTPTNPKVGEGMLFHFCKLFPTVLETVPGSSLRRAE